MRYIKRTVLVAVGIMLLALPLAACAKPATPAAPEKIRFGCAISFSGWAAAEAEMTQWTNYDLWAEDVNAEGGIYVAEYGKSLPVEIVYYDDKSDPATTAKMVEKLIVEDKVDFMLAPFGGPFHYAAVPLANSYGYMMIGVTLANVELLNKAISGEFPYFFQDWPGCEYQWPYLADLMSELGVKSVGLIYVATPGPIDWGEGFPPFLKERGFDVSIVKNYPPDIMDFSPLLKGVKAANPDALFSVSWAQDGCSIIEQMMAIDLNPKMFWMFSASWCSAVYIEKFGKATLEGVMTEGAFSPNMPYRGAREYWSRYVAKYGREPDYGNGPHIYGTLQVYQQAIEKAGTLDRKKVRDIVATETFETMTGTVRFVNNYRRTSTGMVGQWHGDDLKVLMPRDVRNLDPIYPKPAWPK